MPPAAGRELREVLERCAHRDRVRVPGVVDQDPTAWKLELLVPPFRERDVEARRKLEADRGSRRKRGGRSARGAVP